MSAGYDAQLQNTSDRNVRQYSDLDLFFGKKHLIMISVKSQMLRLLKGLFVILFS